METQDSPAFATRAILAKDAEGYSSIPSTDEAKIIKSKYMLLESETTSGKVFCNKSFWFYDNGDNTIWAVKVKQSKGVFSQHKAKIVDFAIPPKSTTEVISLDEDGHLLRWIYKFKEGFLTYGWGYWKFDKAIDKIQSNDSNDRIIVGWSNSNLVVWYFFVQMNMPKSALFYLPTDDFSESPIQNQNTITINNKTKITEIKDVVFSSLSNNFFVLHDKNMISIVDLSNRWLIETIKFEEAEDIDRIFFKDFSNSFSERKVTYQGTLILTAANNTTIYTAEITKLIKNRQIIKNHKFVFLDDKIPKLIKINQEENMIFLINTEAPFKMYWIHFDLLNDKEDDEAIAKLNYIFEITLSFINDINSKYSSI